MKKSLTPEQRKAEGERLWKELNARGIFTEEQLDQAIREVGVIDIGFFVTPLPDKATLSKQEEEEDLVKR